MARAVVNPELELVLFGQVDRLVLGLNVDVSDDFDSELIFDLIGEAEPLHLVGSSFLEEPREVAFGHGVDIDSACLVEDLKPTLVVVVVMNSLLQRGLH